MDDRDGFAEYINKNKKVYKFTAIIAGVLVVVGLLILVAVIIVAAVLMIMYRTS